MIPPLSCPFGSGCSRCMGAGRCLWSGHNISSCQIDKIFDLPGNGDEYRGCRQYIRESGCHNPPPSSCRCEIALCVGLYDRPIEYKYPAHRTSKKPNTHFFFTLFINFNSRKFCTYSYFALVISISLPDGIVLFLPNKYGIFNVIAL